MILRRMGKERDKNINWDFSFNSFNSFFSFFKISISIYRGLSDKYKEFSGGYKSKSVICCPCIHDGTGKVIAVLQIMNKVSTSIVKKFHDNVDGALPLGQSGVPFTSEDLILIQSMALEVSKVYYFICFVYMYLSFRTVFVYYLTIYSLCIYIGS